MSQVRTGFQVEVCFVKLKLRCFHNSAQLRRFSESISRRFAAAWKKILDKFDELKDVCLGVYWMLLKSMENKHSTMQQSESESEAEPHNKGTALGDELVDDLKIRVHFVQLITQVGSTLCLRHWVIATAVVYFRRFYSRYEYKGVNPWLVAAAATHLAALVEEHPKDAQEIYSGFQEQVSKERYPDMWKTSVLSTATLIGDEQSSENVEPIKPKMAMKKCEQLLVEALQFDLMISHPYRELQLMIRDCALQHSEGLLESAWALVNDFYLTDAILNQPPAMIALCALYLAASYKSLDINAWLVTLDVDFDEVKAVCLKISNLYKALDSEGTESTDKLMTRLYGETPWEIAIAKPDTISNG